MSITILEKVLEPGDVARLRAELSAGPWTDGARTAGALARPVKANRQLDSGAPAAAGLSAFVEAALRRHPAFARAAQPARLSPILFSAYENGMAYGPHTDDALAQGLRRDLSFTLFLSPPDSYEGGALEIDFGGLQPAVKLAAGDAVLYPAGTVHQVLPVMQGERLCAVGWVQSTIRRAEERAILSDLLIARDQALEAGRPEALRLTAAIGNLTRLWAD
jgi:PKHD-type hydroxylase